MIYNLYIKTLSNAPDLWDEVEAQDKDEAVDYFGQRYMIKSQKGREFIERCVIKDTDWYTNAKK